MEYRNNFTKFLDKYRTEEIMKLEEPYKSTMTTYLWYNDIKNLNNTYNHVAFRLPGATRGHIEVDKDLNINNIVFYDDTCFDAKHNGVKCYTKEVEAAACSEFLHTKLDIVNGYIDDSYLEVYLKEAGYCE